MKNPPTATTIIAVAPPELKKSRERERERERERGQIKPVNFY